MSIVKTLRFPVRARWTNGRLAALEARGKPPLAVATPPEFKDGIPGIWSPEELMVGALASCYELALVAIAERLGVALRRLEVDATGHVERGRGGYGFTVLELDVALATDPAHEARAREAVELAEEYCTVWRALEVPVRLRLAIAPTPETPAAAQ